MNRDELIFLGTKIFFCQGTEEEIDEMCDIFDKNVPHPLGSNLFFYPEKMEKDFDISKYNPTVEEVIDIALNYKCLVLK